MSKICKFDKSPSQRYYEIFDENNIEISLESNDWDVYFPSSQKENEHNLIRLDKLEGKRIGLITGTNCMIDRRRVWLNLVSSYGREASSKIMPETFIINEINDMKLLKTDKRIHFILKNNRHRRLGLILVETIKSIFEEKEHYDVVQPLITNLCRYRGTSFNLRVYLLLTLQENRLVSYLYYEGICIYGKPPEKGIDLFDRMITHSRNRIPEEFPELMSDLLEVLEIDSDIFFPKLNKKITSLVDSSFHEFGKLENLEKALCFQVFGVDILLDTNNEPIICEVNKGPSMKSKNENHGELKNEMIEELLSVVGLREKENEGFIEMSTWNIVT